MNYRNNLVQRNNQPNLFYPNGWQNQSYNSYQGQTMDAIPYSATAFQAPYYSQAPRPQIDFHWVQGVSGAKAYDIMPGKSAILMDSEANKFYVKSADNNGMPMPLRCFRYTEEAEEVDVDKSGSVDMSQYLTKDDIMKIIDEKLGKNNNR